MHTLSVILIVLAIIFVICIAVPVVFAIILIAKDEKQTEHSILRNYPLLGKMRYIIEKVGPELRQYLFHNDNEAKPFSRREIKTTYISAKYHSRLLGFGSQRDFSLPGFYIKNAFFPTQREEIEVDNENNISSKLYKIDKDNLFRRSEHREDADIAPFLLREEDAIVIGEQTCRQPFRVRGFIGQSAMSYGALGDRAITALSTGLGLAQGTWMNTGEGGLSPHHLKGGADLICQIGPGLFSYRTKEGEFSWEDFTKISKLPNVKAFELKLAQGAKTRGGHVDGAKVTPEIAAIRNLEPWESVDSPNRFNEFSSIEEMFAFIEKLREVGGKPVGIKIVVGHTEDIEELAKHMAQTGKGPDFITVDGAEGGTGASFQELADATGLPLTYALPTLHMMLKRYNVRDRVKLFASGKLITADKVAFALCLGADLVNIARGFMFSVGCIQAQVCHTNHCPVGVASTDPHLQKALIVEEKAFRVCNYVLSLREGVFNLAAAAGVKNPTQLNEHHIAYRDGNGNMTTGEEFFKSGVKATSF
ncbi:FMN-binding glutamate synthase family protein [Aureibacillus halotolerans]|uniref:Glutamate synthase domain-containing protein 2 n=1 Tax=Aureibacillus halotolerans TaxID=1508390 RepID=A0A4R6U244_9BACI|nr:FMN-binding glutamate synthase family protein [Aureibacillus halotolerans]TDQ40488.1 glutamate synthase domain-containing protein 2 [Aureibacillus halotolerans]